MGRPGSEDKPMGVWEYRKHLEEKEVPGWMAAAVLAVVEDFSAFLDGAGKAESDAGMPEAEQFAGRLIAGGRNTPENFATLRDYAGFSGNRNLHVAWIELMDCRNALDVLAGEIEGRHGRGARETVFPAPPPPLGAGERERCAYTRGLTERMQAALSPAKRREAWFHVRHGIPAGHWAAGDAADREKFNRCGEIDAFLDLKRRERDDLLTRLRDERKLWYTVEITDEVLEFVRSDPEMEGGRREGDKIFITKIPYNAVRYLRETDPVRKRYWACHCPLVRRSILDGRPISAEICHCSLGHASHYLAGLGRELRGEVLESVLHGDPRCRFVFHLPPGLVSS
jgi:hypothetical protein